MFSKDDLIKKLRKDKLYRDALKMARTDAERNKIIAATEGFLSTFIDTMIPVAAGLRSDPALAAKLQEGLKRGVTVVSESDGRPVSGSIGR